MPALRLRSNAALLGCLVAALGLFAAGVAAIRMKAEGEKWRRRTASFVEQLNALGETLKPGGVGYIDVAPSEADELVYLPAYCSRTDLIRHFPDRRDGFIERLDRYANGSWEASARVWLRGGKILAIDHARVAVGMHDSLISWNLRLGRAIRVMKEKDSPNPFLSVYFPSNGDPGDPPPP